MYFAVALFLTSATLESEICNLCYVILKLID